MLPIPYLEDVLKIYYDYVKNTLYPSNIKNKLITYLLATFHIIGVLQINYGIFLPPKYLIFNIIYIILIYISYWIFNNHCFITLLTNKLSGKKNTPLYIKFKTAKKIIIFNLVLSIIGFCIPKYSLFNLMKNNIFCD